MKHLIPFILMAIIANAALCQERKYHKINGKIKIDEETYCLYKEIPIEYKNCGTRIPEFTDYSFSTTDSLPVIYLEARALSMFNFKTEKQTNASTVQFYGFWPGMSKNLLDQAKLINYYKIEFSPLQREINVLFHKETFHSFVKDLIWYDVFKNGKFNEAGAEKLIKKWEGKEIDYIPGEVLEKRVSMSYLQADNWRKRDLTVRDNYKIDCENKKIYRNDTVVASYTFNELPDTYASGLASSYVTHYYIVNKEGKMLSDSYSVPQSSFGTFAYYVDNKPNYITFPLVDKCEQKQISIAVDVLIQFGKL